MLEGISTNRHCDPFAACLLAAGKRFVFRYHSRTTRQAEKRVTPKEAAELARAGLDVATVYQDNARTPADFGFERGRLDGASAQTYAGQTGQPPGSAIYFAVDADFSASEVRQYVLDYFRGVKVGMDESAGGASAFALGVYGSGLVCRLVRDENALARYAWLAEATGWRESATYSAWDVRQHVNGGDDLCGLGVAWERCEAREKFGQFRPIGFDVEAGQGELRRVTASQLNLRLAPSQESNPPIARLPEGQIVRVLGAAVAPWLRVRTTLGGGDVIGYASGKYLVPVDAAIAVPPIVSTVPAVHYRENDAGSNRASTAKRAQPLGETPRPARDALAAEGRVAQLGDIVAWLAVDGSPRYRRDQVTYCNVYATDYCYLAGVYLPRTWWTESALMRMVGGEPAPAAQYDRTIREMRADDLYAWLCEFGPSFGWTRVFDASALQNVANGGGVGIICADRAEAGKPGHITVVVPEASGARATRDADGNVTRPLQSQAGATNFRYSSGVSAWWQDARFRAYGLFVHA